MSTIETGKPLPQQLLESTVQTREGQPVTLSSLIDRRPTALVFIRHFGCLGCSLQMEDLAPRVEELSSLGLNLVLVGNGEPRYIEGFLQRYNLKADQLTVVTDPSLKAYTSAGLRRAVSGTIGPRGMLEMFRALLGGHTQDGIKGDNWQQGGAIVTDSEGTVAYYHRNDTVGDLPQSTALVDTVYSLLADRDPLYSG